MSTFTVLNPATEETVATVPSTSAEETDAAIARAVAAQAAWRAAPSATYSSGSGTKIGVPKIPAASRQTASERAPPPISSTRRQSTPCPVR